MPKTKKREQKERKIRPYEERLAEIEKKIAFHERAISALKTRKERMQNPSLSREDKKSILTEVAQSGFSPEEIAKILEDAKKDKENS